MELQPAEVPIGPANRSRLGDAPSPQTLSTYLLPPRQSAKPAGLEDAPDLQEGLAAASDSPSFYSAPSLSYTRRRGRLWDTAWEAEAYSPGRVGQILPCCGCAQRREAALLATRRRPEKVGTVASSWSGGRAPESASLGACGSRRRSPGFPPADVESPVWPALRLSLRDASRLEVTRKHSKGRGGGLHREALLFTRPGQRYAEVRLPPRFLLFTPRIFPLASPTKRRGDLSLRSIDRSRPTFWLH